MRMRPTQFLHKTNHVQVKTVQQEILHKKCELMDDGYDGRIPKKKPKFRIHFDVRVNCVSSSQHLNAYYSQTCTMLSTEIK